MSGSIWLFVLIAVIVLAAFGVSLYWASKRGASRGQALALALIVPLAAAALYVACGTPQVLNAQSAHGAAGRPGGAPPDPKVMVAKLEQRLKDHPEDLDGWLMLARSYTVMGRYAEAADAFEHAQAKAVQDKNLLVTWIQLRIMLAGRKFDARTQQLVAQAGKLAPGDPDVLLLLALSAYDRNDQAAGDALVDKLHQRYPPGDPDRQSLDAALEKWKTRDAAAQAMPANQSMPANHPPVPPASGASAAGPSPGNPVSVPDVNTMVQRLADRLKQHPEDQNGWLMLARSYAELGRYADADAAFGHARQLAMQNISSLTIWIEMRLRLNGMKWDERARELLDRATALAPGDDGVLLMRALAAFDSGDQASANALVNQLHQRFPPGTPDRQQLDAALKQLRPPAAPGKP